MCVFVNVSNPTERMASVRWSVSSRPCWYCTWCSHRYSSPQHFTKRRCSQPIYSAALFFNTVSSHIADVRVGLFAISLFNVPQKLFFGRVESWFSSIRGSRSRYNRLLFLRGVPPKKKLVNGTLLSYINLITSSTSKNRPIFPDRCAT